MTDGPIILFDAQCVLCSANAQFILRHDRRHGIDPTDPDTILVVDGDNVLQDSDAVIAIYTGLGWPWRVAGVARLVPNWLRDRAYRWIARNRYRFFGRRSTCWLPAPEDAGRILS